MLPPFYSALGFMNRPVGKFSETLCGEDIIYTFCGVCRCSDDGISPTTVDERYLYKPRALLETFDFWCKYSGFWLQTLSAFNCIF